MSLVVGNGRMTRLISNQGVIALTLTVIALAGVGLWSLHVDRQGVTLGLICEPITPDTSAEFVNQLGSASRSSHVRSLRPEHFYRPLHWSVASAPLRARFGPGSLGCP